ncbi:hypothetical protein [Aeromonas sobria]|jgi:hypothetical protein|uniref:hypothetical protein n=1 Tax=Aeromonas sobria TaxID=646 RepID=UPI003F368238
MDISLTGSAGILLTAVSSLVGAVIGGWMTRNATINATNIANEHQRQLAKDAEDTLLTGFIWSIHDEIESLFRRYNETVGIMLRDTPEGEMLPIKYRAEHDYFSVYHSNSALIGKVRDHELRSDIIYAYTMAKSILDSYSIYWELMTTYEGVCRSNAIEPSPINEHYVIIYQNQLVLYTKELKNIDSLLCTSLERLLKRIKKSYVR